MNHFYFNDIHYIYCAISNKSNAGYSISNKSNAGYSVASHVYTPIPPADGSVPYQIPKRLYVPMWGVPYSEAATQALAYEPPFD